MKIIFLFALTTALTIHILVLPLFAQCTAAEMIQLKKNGFSVEEIKTLCAPTANKSQQKDQTLQAPAYQQPMVQMGQRCATDLGVCGLYHLPPTPVGTPCYCVNRFTGQRDNGRI